MKLDPKIKKDFIIFSPFAVDYAKEEVRKYINTKCYFCDDIIAYEGLGNCDVGILAGFNYTGYHPYIPVGDTEGYKFCLPAAFVEEEEKLKPYSSLIQLPFTIGDIILLRGKSETSTVERCTCTSISIASDNTIVLISFGTTTYTPKELLEDYEWKSAYLENTEFKPFGVKEE